jgi:hypothetical protein
MSPASKPLDLDARSLYRRSFVLFLLAFDTSLSGPDAVFATARPSGMLGWLNSPLGRDEVAVVAASAGRSAGVFDE